MELVRCLTADGIGEFAHYLSRLRVDGDAPPPKSLLNDDVYSIESTLGDVWVDPRDFASRREFAEYIDERFLEASVFVDADEPGMWEWLSLFYFDAVCPVNQHGVRRPGVDGRHLLDDPDARRRHRHLLRSPYMLFRQYDGGPNGELDLLLSYALPVHGVAATHIGERLRLMASRGALVAASRLYFDRASMKPRRGYSHIENGLRAYCKFINNLPGFFNLSELSVDTVMALLPKEFEDWMDNEADNEQLRNTRRLFGDLTQMDLPSDGSLAAKLDDLLQEVGERRVTARQAKVRSDMFRTAVLAAYDSRCAISGMGLRCTEGPESAIHEVEAAHIIPVSRGGRDLVRNGLALSRTVHWAFDHGMLWFDEDLRVSISSEVESDRRNQWLKQFCGRPLKVPVDDLHRPLPDALRWHTMNVARVAPRH